MKRPNFFLLSVLLIALSNPAFSQFFNNLKQISVFSGVGHLNVKDAFISTSHYTGNSIDYGIKWSDSDSLKGYLFNMSFQNCKNLKAFNTSGKISNFSIQYNHYFYIVALQILKLPFECYIGPGFSSLVSFRDQNYSQQFSLSSTTMLISPVFASRFIIPVKTINTSLALTANYSFPLFGARPNTAQGADLKTQTHNGFIAPYEAINFIFGLSAAYNLMNHISVEAEYMFHYSGIYKWEEYNMISDNLILTCGVTF